MTHGVIVGVGIVFGIVLVNVAIWLGAILIYALITLAESLAKICKRKHL